MFLGRVVGPDESTWLPLDREKVIAWRREDAQHCPHCRTRRSDWDRDRDAYVGQLDTCPGCELLEQENRNIPDGRRGHVRPYLVPRHLLDPEQLTADVEGGGR